MNKDRIRLIMRLNPDTGCFNCKHYTRSPSGVDPKFWTEVWCYFYEHYDKVDRLRTDSFIAKTICENYDR